MSGAPIVPVPWTFTQLGPPGATLKLDGYNAPFGRPRKSPVAETELELRDGETYYAGNDVPDRHIFGSKQAPIELAGRWMDSRIGQPGGARAFAQSVKQFVNAKVEVHGEWGGILAFTGLISKLHISYESAEELAWKMTIKVSSDDTQPPTLGAITPAVSTTDLVNSVLSNFFNVEQRVANIPPDIQYQPSFLDTVASLISTCNSVSATFSTFADSVDNYESALASDVAHFRSGIAQYSTAVQQLQITMGSAENDLGIASSVAASQTRYALIRAQNDEDMLEILALLAQCDLAAEVVQKGQPGKVYVAKSGDTWESIGLSLLGDADGADALRQANGVRYGIQPLAGQQVHCPKPT